MACTFLCPQCGNPMSMTDGGTPETKGRNVWKCDRCGTGFAQDRPQQSPEQMRELMRRSMGSVRTYGLFVGMPMWIIAGGILGGAAWLLSDSLTAGCVITFSVPAVAVVAWLARIRQNDRQMVDHIMSYTMRSDPPPKA